MREILFKAKRVDNGELIYWNLWGELIRESGKRTRITVKKGATTSYYDYVHQIRHLIDESTISQYIGLCDKNGRKIWENDVVDMNRKGCGFKRIEKVFYEEGAFSPISVHGWECVPDADEIEVIGNVFDNPELLEGN